jgi:hypothetical protein
LRPAATPPKSQRYRQSLLTIKPNRDTPLLSPALDHSTHEPRQLHRITVRKKSSLPLAPLTLRLVCIQSPSPPPSGGSARRCSASLAGLRGGWLGRAEAKRATHTASPSSYSAHSLGARGPSGMRVAADGGRRRSHSVY